MGAHQDAIGHFTKAVELDGRLSAALANLGHVLDDMGDAPRSRARALAHRLANRRRLAVVGLYDEAVSHFRRAVDIDGTQASWYKKLGISLVHLEKYKEGLSLVVCSLMLLLLLLLLFVTINE
jgi:tetratricopeptide (TPR) repeat protein